MLLRPASLLRAVVLACSPILTTSATAISAQAVQVPALAGLDGTWQGAVRQPDGSDNRWVVKIEKAGASWKGTLWFIDQKSPAIPIDTVGWSNGTLDLDIQRTGMTYQGKMSPDGNSIVGTRAGWRQQGTAHLCAGNTGTAWAIPEPPPPLAKMDPNANPGFEVSTIKPQAPGERNFAFLINRGSFIGRGLTLEKLMTISMSLNAAQIAGLPAWAKEDKYDIDAKPDTPGAPSLKQFYGEVVKLMVERYGLKYHTETRTMTAFSLNLAKGGIRMKPSPADSGDIPGFGLPPGQLRIFNATMKEFSGLLQSDILDHPVVDQTG